MTTAWDSSLRRDTVYIDYDFDLGIEPPPRSPIFTAFNIVLLSCGYKGTSPICDVPPDVIDVLMVAWRLKLMVERARRDIRARPM